MTGLFSLWDLEGTSTTIGMGLGPVGVDAISFARVNDLNSDKIDVVQIS